MCPRDADFEKHARDVVLVSASTKRKSTGEPRPATRDQIPDALKGSKRKATVLKGDEKKYA
jgi:hypothetical protein